MRVRGLRLAAVAFVLVALVAGAGLWLGVMVPREAEQRLQSHGLAKRQIWKLEMRDSLHHRIIDSARAVPEKDRYRQPVCAITGRVGLRTFEARCADAIRLEPGGEAGLLRRERDLVIRGGTVRETVERLVFSTDSVRAAAGLDTAHLAALDYVSYQSGSNARLADDAFDTLKLHEVVAGQPKSGSRSRGACAVSWRAQRSPGTPVHVTVELRCGFLWPAGESRIAHRQTLFEKKAAGLLPRDMDFETYCADCSWVEQPVTLDFTHHNLKKAIAVRAYPGLCDMRLGSVPHEDLVTALYGDLLSRDSRAKTGPYRHPAERHASSSRASSRTDERVWLELRQGKIGLAGELLETGLPATCERIRRDFGPTGRILRDLLRF